jgi:dsDNA-binding SOS-regulon protein
MAKRQKKGMPFQMTLPSDLTTQLVEKLYSLSPGVKTGYLKEQLLTKFVSKDTDPASLRRERAIAKWLATEVKNEETNERLNSTHEDYQILPHVPFGSFVEWCRRFVIDIIGEIPPEEALVGSFSGGASTSRKRTDSHPALKYAGISHVTPRCHHLWESAKTLMPGWHTIENPYFGPFKPVQDWVIDGTVRPGRYGPFNRVPTRVTVDTSVEEVKGNVLFTVPKKSDIDRVACKEPDINMFIQKGVGTFLRRRLRTVGIDLNDQSRNRDLARLGSITNQLATLDLSSASDSVTRELVFLLLPIHWFTLLDASRCHVTIIDGVEHQNHMFSSMGNGFTFELESLLFFVLCKAVARFTGTRGVISVYGDDIICPTDMYHEISWVLGYFGFSLNMEKSYPDGPFRESCGGHYYLGDDITPFYIRDPVDRMDKLIDVANKLREWSRLSPTLNLLNPETEEIWLWLKQRIPRCLWGGVDTAFKYQLVSRDTPEQRLFEETDSSGTGIGGYFHWLNATWDRASPSDGITTSRRITATGKFRLKRALPSAVNRLETYFYHEI